MLLCPTVFLKIKRECTLVQGQCDKMVTSAISSLGKLKQEKFNQFLFSFTAAVQAMWPCQWIL